MKTQEILAAVVLIAVVGWIGFMAASSNAAYSPANAAANTASQYNAQQAAAQAAGATNTQTGSQAAAGAAANNAESGAGEVVTIPIKVVNGYYEPRQITVKQGTKVRLDLDPNTMRGCMTTFNIWGMGGSKLSKYVSSSDHILEFTANTPGVYKTSCNMGMGDGRIIVEAADANTAQAGTTAANTANAANGQAQNAVGAPALAAPSNSDAGPSGGSCGAGGCGCGCGSK